MIASALRRAAAMPTVNAVSTPGTAAPPTSSSFLPSTQRRLEGTASRR
jgi:hypothetical protein